MNEIDFRRHALVTVYGTKKLNVSWNTRRNNATSMVEGRGCASLVFTAVAGVGFSVTKVIVGSEYIHSCPSKDMIPVYIVISGCLPVLLSPLRQSFRKGPRSEKQDTFAMRVAFITAIFGIVVNLAWLVAGTYLVTTTIHYGNICPKNAIKMANTLNCKDGVVVPHNSTSITEDLSASKNCSIYSDTNATGSETKTNSSLISYVSDNSTNSDAEDTMVMDTGENNNGSSRKQYVTSDGLEIHSNSTCIVCDLTILRFSLAVVIIDWIFVAFGLIYFCCFIKHFISFLKNEFPLNA